MFSREQVELVAKSAADCAAKPSNRSNREIGSASAKKLRRESFMMLRRIILKKDKTQLAREDIFKSRKGEHCSFCGIRRDISRGMSLNSGAGAARVMSLHARDLIIFFYKSKLCLMINDYAACSQFAINDKIGR